jgi:hypothetical protein
LANLNDQVLNIPQSLACFRLWKSSKSGDQKEKFCVERRLVIKRIVKNNYDSLSKYLEKQAYAYSYYEQADYYADRGKIKKAINYFWKGCLSSPIPPRIFRLIKILKKYESHQKSLKS